MRAAGTWNSCAAAASKSSSLCTEPDPLSTVAPATSFTQPHSIMERVLGLGGIFFKSRDPDALAEWYHDHLGIPIEEGQTFGSFIHGSGEGEEVRSVWSTFPQDTEYFQPSQAPFMINYRVADLDKMLEQLRAAGAAVDDRVEEYAFGRFGWASDPEGNRFELWEPARDQP